MALEILFNVILLGISGYTLFYVRTTAAASTYTDPLGTAFWPSALLIILSVLLIINIIQVIHKIPKEKRNFNVLKEIHIKAIIKSNLFWGIIGMIVYALLLPVTGFLLTSFLLAIYMAYFLEERRKSILVLFAFLSVAIIFVIFYRVMGILLPRGSIPFLRSFAIAVETFLRNIG